MFWSDEDGGYVATTPELEGVSAFAETPEGALSELAVARDLWLEELAVSGQEPPPPLNTLIVQLLSEARGAPQATRTDRSSRAATTAQ
jgi:predicted RNase H-like HicB family nuclease